jgi:pimeloyl-ACP methyl ester carboxylesterase
VGRAKIPRCTFRRPQPLAKYFPNSKLIVFPGVGHLPYEECPEEFNRELIEFLTREKLPA